MAHASMCSMQILPSHSLQGLQPRQRPAAFRAARIHHKRRGGGRCAAALQESAGGNEAPSKKTLADDATIEEVTGQQKQWAEERAAPSSAPGSEKPGEKIDIPEELKSEGDRKAEEVERLRAAEKFMKKGTGEGECQACGFVYSPKDGDDEYPIPKGTVFENLPDDWQCPVCGAAKTSFNQKQLTVAGFAENQSYGLGTNSMTEGQKSLLIFGSLAGFFVLFLLGYLL